MTTRAKLNKAPLSVSNAVDSRSMLVAHEEGLDLELVKMAGSAHVNTVDRPGPSLIDPSSREGQRVVAGDSPKSGCNNILSAVTGRRKGETIWQEESQL